MATVAPSTSPKPSYTTILRPARRHRDRADEDESAANPARRRLIVLGVVLAMAAAAVGGVFAAGGGGSSPKPPGPTVAQQATAQRAAARQQTQAVAAERRAIVQDGTDQLVTVITQLAPHRSRDVTRFTNTSAPTAQIAAAKRVQTDYLKAAAEASAFTGQTPQAAPLVKALKKAAAGYGAMASAARAQNDVRFNAARKATTAAEKALSTQVAKL